ncbi:MAG: hypothetical protein AAF581_13915 [Planctomycetota bacterium]
MNIPDAVYGRSALFQPGAPQPPAPGAMNCGQDPTMDTLDDCVIITGLSAVDLAKALLRV